MKLIKLQGNDNVEDIVATAASGLADDAFNQYGMKDVVDEHPDEWYFLMEDIREAIFAATNNAVNEYFKQL